MSNEAASKGDGQMSKNKVQFQTGYGLTKLSKNYGTESQYTEAFFY
ncbi:MAG: hypothetical protein HOP02_10025 [Methylococcaceae bacterium]|nr:hypothetical protein [Methylococcaceae bacterium]